MKSPHVAQPVAPRRVSHTPAGHLRDGSAGHDVIDLARRYGLDLDPWQEDFLIDAMVETSSGLWATPRTGLSVPRQNGKGSVIEAIELGGLLLFGDELIIHSAHEYKTAIDGFRRIREYFENYDDLRKKVKRVSTSTAREFIELRSGQTLRFMARSKQSGRGFSADRLILDEAQELSEDVWAAILPTTSARPNPQIHLFGTPPAPNMNGEVFTRLRDVAIAGTDDRLTYVEFAAREEDDPAEPATWGRANPAYGIRIREDTIRDEFNSMDGETFARERLGMWDGIASNSVIPEDTWLSLVSESDPLGKVAFAIDVSPDRSKASIGVAGYLADGEVVMVQTIENRKGTGWVANRVKELTDRWPHVAVVIDAGGPAAALLPELKKAKVKRILTISSREVAQACGAFYDAVFNQRLAHPDQPVLNEALAAARKRQLGDAWAWHRKDSTADLTPLVAVTFAAYGLSTKTSAARDRSNSKVLVL